MKTKICETKHIPHPFELFGVECGKGWYPQRWRRNSDDKLFWVNTDGTLEEINEDEQK